MRDGDSSLTDRATRLTDVLICVHCGGGLRAEGDELIRCSNCGEPYEVEAGTARMLPRDLRGSRVAASSEKQLKARTAKTFAYEWETFGDTRPEWWKNFLDYMQPHPPEFFDGISVLDVGTGSGRHARIAASLGARVVAVDLGSSIDVARRNLPPEVITVQADAEALPLAPASFDFVMSIGVLHHLPDTERALRRLVRYVRPGGRLHVYLYWVPPRPGHRLILRGITLVRRLTTRLPHRLLHVACYPLAAVLFTTIVLPYRIMNHVRRLERIADALPLKAYADYPFGVLVNDQFDRFSAPIERRFTQDEAERMMRDAGLVDVVVLPNNGWVCDGRLP
jgi:SAM-dependent methyltransferase